MNTVQTIYRKLSHLPPPAQEEVLSAVEHIEEKYGVLEPREEKGLLDLLAEITIDGPTDLAERHDYYAHGKVEE